MKEPLEPQDMVAIGDDGKPLRIRWPRGVFRFKRGDKVWVRDPAHHKDHRGRGGYCIVPARVIQRHHHPDRHPFYPRGEGYRLQGYLYWDCYPGCRVFATKEQATKARLGDIAR